MISDRDCAIARVPRRLSALKTLEKGGGCTSLARCRRRSGSWRSFICALLGHPAVNVELDDAALLRQFSLAAAFFKVLNHELDSASVCQVGMDGYASECEVRIAGLHLNP